MWWQIPLGLCVGLATGLFLLWLTFVIALAVTRPRGGPLRDLARMLPDVLRLVARLTRDRSLPPGVRRRVVLLGVYLASPVDLVPDFIPVLGLADDAILVALVLRRVVRRAGPAALARHWPGSPEGLATLLTVLRLPFSRTVQPAVRGLGRRSRS